MVRKLFVYFCIAVSIILSTSNLLRSRGQIGHNWDFTFPVTKNSFQNLKLVSEYTWSDQNFGQSQILTIAQIIPNRLLSLIVDLSDPYTGVRVLIILVIALSIIGFSELLTKTIDKNNHSLLPSLLYGLSPFLFNEIIGGSWYMWVSYAAIPWYLLAGYHLVFKGNYRYLVLYLLSSLIVVSSMQNFVLIELGFFTFLMLNCKSVYFRKSLLRYFYIHLYLIIINLPWILVMVHQLSKFSGEVTAPGFSSGFSQVLDSHQTLVNILNLSGYWDRHFYYFAVPELFRQYYTAAVVLVWITSLFYLFVFNRGSKRSGALITFCFLLFLILIKGGNQPFRDLTIFLYQHISFLNLYRSPQHLMLVPAVTLPLLVGLSLNASRGRVRQLLNTIYLLFFVVILSGWWYRGDLGTFELKKQGKNFVDTFSLSPDIYDTFKLNREIKLDHRILFLPAVQSPKYIKTYFQSDAQGGYPEYMYLGNPTYTSERNDIARGIESDFCTNYSLDLVKSLTNTNTLLVSSRSDILPMFTPCVDKWNAESVKVTLSKNNKLKNEIPGEYAGTFSLGLSDYNPLFQMTNSSNGILEYKKINPTLYVINLHNVNDNTVSLVFRENFDKDWYLTPASIERKALTSLNDYKIFPFNEKYQATKDEIREFETRGYLSSLGEGRTIIETRFDWKDGMEKKTSEDIYNFDFVSKNIKGTIQNNNLPRPKLYSLLLSSPAEAAVIHTKFDTYGNGWSLDISQYCFSYPKSCVKNQNGSVDISFLVEYYPQRLLYFGIIAALFILIPALFLLRLFISRKAVKNV